MHEGKPGGKVVRPIQLTLLRQRADWTRVEVGLEGKDCLMETNRTLCISRERDRVGGWSVRWRQAERDYAQRPGGDIQQQEETVLPNGQWAAECGRQVGFWSVSREHWEETGEVFMRREVAGERRNLMKFLLAEL